MLIPGNGAGGAPELNAMAETTGNPNARNGADNAGRPWKPGESHKMLALHLGRWPLAETLDQDVQALKEWLGRAWRYLADPAMTRIGRRELRYYMREAEAALRSGLQQRTARDRARREAYADCSSIRSSPDFRVLNITTPG